MYWSFRILTDRLEIYTDQLFSFTDQNLNRLLFNLTHTKIVSVSIGQYSYKIILVSISLQQLEKSILDNTHVNFDWKINGTFNKFDKNKIPGPLKSLIIAHL